MGLCRQQVPVFLVRGDGIIYATGLTFTYTPEPGESSPSSSLRSRHTGHTDSVTFHTPATAGLASAAPCGVLQPPPAHIANGGGGYSVLTASDRFVDVS